MKKFIFPIIFLGFSIIICSSNMNLKANNDSDKLCALTFDDGPDSRLTPRVLEKLEKYKVVATFFLVGQLINDNTQPVLERARRLGCEFGNHSWAWNSMNTMTEEEIKESVEKTSEAIIKYTGTAPEFFRPPNLAVSDRMYEAIDMPFAGGIVGYDWAGCNTTAEDRADSVLKGMRDGAIVLLHDVQPEPHPTPEALDILIPELQKQGYRFVTLSELFVLKQIKPMPHEHKLWVYVEP